MRKKQNGGWKLSDTDWFYFSFYNPSCFFYDPSWSESNFILFLFFYSIRVDPTQTGGQSYPVRLAKMFVCPVPKISQVMMKWCRRASHLGRFTLWHNRRWASQLAGKFTLWLHNSVDLFCGTTAACLHNSIDLLYGTTNAELHNSPVTLLCDTTDSELNNPVWCAH